jgi:hypothetical protein
VTTEASIEYERVRERYAPMRAGDMALYAAGFVALFLANFTREVGWPVYAGMVSAAATWEITKFRLRQNARHYAEGGQRR